MKTDFNRGQNFSNYKTFRWYQGKSIPGDKLEANLLVKKRVINSANKVFSERGFVEADEVQVDFVVVVHAGIKDKRQVTNWGRYSWNDP